MPIDKIVFEPNKPVIVTLRYPHGKKVASKFSDYEVFYSCEDGRGFYASPVLDDEIRALAPEAGEPFSICRAMGKRWTVERIDKTRSPQRPADPHPPAAAATNNNNAQEAPPRHRQTTQGQSRDIPTKLPIDDAVRTFLIVAGRAKQEAERVLGFPVDQVVQDLATTLFIHAGHEGWLTWLATTPAPIAAPGDAGSAPPPAVSPSVAGAAAVNPRAAAKAAAEKIAAEKIADMQRKAPERAGSGSGDTPWRNDTEMLAMFATLREHLGEMRYIQEMTLAGVKAPQQLRYLNQRIALYERLVAIARLEEAC